MPDAVSVNPPERSDSHVSITSLILSRDQLPASTESFHRRSAGPSLLSMLFAVDELVEAESHTPAGSPSFIRWLFSPEHLPRSSGLSGLGSDHASEDSG